MKKLLLIHGESGSGKSTAARRLLERLRANNTSCEVVGSDDVYVNFIKSRYPTIYFEHLCRFIAGHRRRIMEDANKGRTGREDAYSEYANIVTNWQTALIESLLRALERVEIVLAEGCFLEKDAKPGLVARDGEQGYELLECRVHQRCIYYKDNLISEDELLQILCDKTFAK